ncbi:hypothetical protein N9H68_07360 [Planktomarina temperata]|nr:hypothetical protein [Planktomarina temperata]
MFFGGVGDDSIVIEGNYADAQFVTITLAEFTSIQTTALGDAAVQEIFVYQNATTGDAVLLFEEETFDGSVTNGAGGMSTLTITDHTLDLELVDPVTIEGNDYTIINANEAVIA